MQIARERKHAMVFAVATVKIPISLGTSHRAERIEAAASRQA
jgi:hypothetical protein